jgi:hypothetical protein
MDVAMNRALVAALGIFLVACSATSKPFDDLDERPAPNADSGRSGDGFEGELESGAPDDQEVCVATSARAITPPVDLVFTVDQSGSMADDIANVKANVNRLAAFLDKTNLDYRVVMIASHGAPHHSTTDSKRFEVCVPPPLGGPRCGDPNPPRFRQIDRNVQSWDSLKIILSTYDAADPALSWKASLRPGALEVFVPITDDDSKIQPRPGAPPITCSDAEIANVGNRCVPDAKTFDRLLLAKPGGHFGTEAARNYVFYPIVGASAFPSEQTCGRNAVNNGEEYLTLAKLTRGRWFPICLTDFAPVFDQIAQDIVARVACEVTIPPSPNGTIDHEKVNVSWTTTAGVKRPFVQDSARPCDGGADGWQYAEEKSKIVLCGQACRDLRADPGARLDVEFGCRTAIR